MIKLTHAAIGVLGTPNFVAANPAKILIAAGLYEDKGKKVEYEQAVYIHWAWGLLEEHGPLWKKEGEKILKECCKKLEETP